MNAPIEAHLAPAGWRPQTFEYDFHVNPTREATVSLRWLVPLLRVHGPTAEDLTRLASEGLALRDLADPAARIRQRAAQALVGAAAEHAGSSELGLVAAEQLAPCDFETVELAVRSCATLRQAIELLGRRMPLLHGGIAPVLVEDATHARWELRQLDDCPAVAACDDFALAATYRMCARYLARPCSLREVHVRHDQETQRASYERVFPGALVRFGQRHDALLFTRECLETPMAQAHTGLRRLYEAQLDARLAQADASCPMGLRVRQVLHEQLRSGDAGIASIAEQLEVNVSTLRRELASEGTTYRRLREELRSELAERYLRDRALTVSEVAFLLGFATVAAFSKAFRRAHAVPPTTYRARVRSSLSARPASL